MYSANVKNYKRIEIESASPGKLLLMLYDGAVEYADLAAEKMRDSNDADSIFYTNKVQAIVTHFLSTLNMEAGEISANLFSLYEFILRKLQDAQSNKSIDDLHHVKDLLVGLRDSWREIVNGVSQQVEDADEGDVVPVKMQKANPYASASKEKVKSINFTG